MKLVAVSRVLNEDDIIESFVRHHAPLIDHHVLLDNGSIDRTVEILGKLKEKGLPVTVFSNRTPTFTETAFNTFLYRYAIEEQQADAVIFLDADEFLDLRRIGIGLRTRLAELPEDRPGLRLRLIEYHSSSVDDAKDLLVPRRVRLRERTPGSTEKVFMRRLLPSWKVVVEAGNHKASFDGKELSLVPENRIVLAHFSDRGRWRWLSRVAIGRLKVLAAGRQEVAQNRNEHYVSPYEMLRNTPDKLGLAANFGAFPPPSGAWIDDRIAYAGGPLQFTVAGDERLKALRAVVAVAEGLAEQHARLIDTNHAVKLQVDQWATQFQRVV